jgi:tetratricopeptide (TPR) repeat protein
VLSIIKKAIKIAEENKFISLLSYCYNNLGVLHMQNPEKAISYLYQAIKWINTETGSVNIRQLGNTYSNIAGCYLNLNNYDSTKLYLDKAKIIYDTLKSSRGYAVVYVLYGNMYLKMNNKKKAEESYLNSLKYAKEVNSFDDMWNATLQLYKLYKMENNTSEALKMLELHKQTNDSLLNIESQKMIQHNVTKFEFEKKQLADSLKVAEEKKVSSAKLKAEKTTKYVLIVVLALVLVFVYFLFTRYKLINTQKKLIQQQKDLLENHQKEILDSIKYAKRIQEAHLPNLNFLNKYLKNKT